MMLRREDEAELADSRELVGGGNEPVLDRPAAVPYRPSRVGRLVAGQHLVYRRIADRVRSHPPAATIQFRHRHREPVRRNRLQAVERPAATERLGVRLPHPAALEPAVDPQLDTTDAQPLVAFVLPRGPSVDQGTQLLHRAGSARAEQEVDPHPQLPSPLQLGQQLVLVRRTARVPDARQAGRVEPRMLGEPVGDARLDVPRGRRIERHQVLGGVDQLAVQRPVVVAADLAAGGHRRVRRDAPPRQSGGVQHVLVTAPDDDAPSDAQDAGTACVRRPRPRPPPARRTTPETATHRCRSALPRDRTTPAEAPAVAAWQRR